MTTYSCNICNQNFTNKTIRDRHRKNICISNITVRKQNGEEETIEKVNGKFTCLCGTSVTRTDHFQKHWKECQIQGWIHLKQCNIDNRNNAEKKDLHANLDDRRVLWFSCLQGLQCRTTPWMGKRSLCKAQSDGSSLIESDWLRKMNPSSWLGWMEDA